MSALYYIENLFSPSYYMGYDEGTAHKITKYVACLAFSIAFCLLARSYFLLTTIVLMTALAGYLSSIGSSLDISTVSILIVATMLAFLNVPTIWESQLRAIGKAVVYAGAIVGLFSIIELAFLATLFESVWTSTGGIRSVSTMFNPNNLGLYAGACLILLAYLRLPLLWSTVCGALISFAFVSSGSRTAWVSLLVVLIYQILGSKRFRSSISDGIRRHKTNLILVGLALTATFAIFQAVRETPDIEEVNRGADLYTASIRLDNFSQFVDAIDEGILVPDLVGRRLDFIQDNFYLVMLNSFGVAGLLLLISLLVANLSWRRSNNPDYLPWKLIFAYYMISGLSGSQLNSFPNNQLFFVSMGALFTLRAMRPRTHRNKIGSETEHMTNGQAKTNIATAV